MTGIEQPSLKLIVPIQKIKVRRNFFLIDVLLLVTIYCFARTTTSSSKNGPNGIMKITVGLTSPAESRLGWRSTDFRSTRGFILLIVF